MVGNGSGGIKEMGWMEGGVELMGKGMKGGVRVWIRADVEFPRHP